MASDLNEEIQNKEKTFRRYLRNAKQELESEHTNWTRLSNWMKLASEESTRLSELNHTKKIIGS